MADSVTVGGVPVAAEFANGVWIQKVKLDLGEHSTSNPAYVVLPVDGSKETFYTAVYDYDGNGNLIYSGKAAIGSSKSSAVWQIKKYSYSGSSLTDIQWAGGAQTFVSIWNNRASLSYS